jgi:hypothetical protein
VTKSEGAGSPKNSPNHEQRKFACPNPNCKKVMILTDEEYARRTYVCPYCNFSNDPRKFVCPNPGCRKVMILTDEEYAQGIYHCPYCNDTSDPEINRARVRRKKFVRSFTEPCVRSAKWLNDRTPNWLKKVSSSAKNVSPDILNELLIPHCEVKRTRGHAFCSNPNCRRSIMHIFWVDGEPYGSTCYREAVRAFEAARRKAIAERRRVRRGL